MNKTNIDWCDYTWNPGHGCTRVSPGCLNCYAESLAKTRLRGQFDYPLDDPFKVVLSPHKLDEPMKVKKPGNVFVWSMGDIFHKDVPIEYIQQVFSVIEACPQHRFLILTKRPGNAPTFLSTFDNVFAGVSIENANYINRAKTLFRKFKSHRLFVSIEPLLGFISMPALSTLYLMDWIIVGGESGNKARACKPEWVRTIRDFCLKENIPFFFKGWGWHIPEGQEKGLLDGIRYDQFPKGLYI